MPNDLESFESQEPARNVAVGSRASAEAAALLEQNRPASPSTENPQNVLDRLTHQDSFRDIYGDEARGPSSSRENALAEGTYVVKPGETPQSLARAQLGNSASQAEVDFYVKTLSRINYSDQIVPGQSVRLPGRNPDGSLYHTRGDKSKETIMQDGTVRTEKPDGSLFTHYADGRYQFKGADGYEYGSGPKPEHHYLTGPWGRMEKDKDGNKHYQFTNGNRSIERPDGTETITRPDGSSTIKRPDGTRTEIAKNGDKLHYQADSIVREETNGTKRTSWNDGAVRTERPDGSGEVRYPWTGPTSIRAGWGPKPEQNFVETYDSQSGTTVRKGQDSTTTRYADGNLRVERSDGTGYTRSLDGREHHWGPRESQNFDREPNLQRLEDERKRLQQVADSAIPPEHRLQFAQDMVRFEERAQRQGISAEDVARTYEQTRRLLGTPNAVTPLESRALAAQSVLSHVANPDNVNQGNHNTCTVTAASERVYTRNPARAAEMVASAAINGEWTAPDGKVVKLDRQSLVPGVEERRNPTVDGERSYATQLLNLTMTNDITQRRNPPRFYRQEPNQSISDTGERIYDAQGRMQTSKQETVPGSGIYVDKPIDWPNVSSTEVTELSRRLSGEDEVAMRRRSSFVVAGEVTFANEVEMGAQLKRLKDQRQLPITLSVDGNVPPFGTTGGPGGAHVVSITDYDASTGRVRVSNQWGRRDDIWVDRKVLFGATR